MSNIPKTYQSYLNWKEKSKQTEYTEETPLLAPDGTLLAKGWAKHNVFTYNRDYVKKGIMSRKEWDFYQVSDGKYMVQLSFANISIGGYVSAKLVDLVNGKEIIDCTQLFLGGGKHIPPAKIHRQDSIRRISTFLLINTSPLSMLSNSRHSPYSATTAGTHSVYVLIRKYGKVPPR